MYQNLAIIWVALMTLSLAGCGRGNAGTTGEAPSSEQSPDAADVTDATSPDGSVGDESSVDPSAAGAAGDNPLAGLQLGLAIEDKQVADAIAALLRSKDCQVITMHSADEVATQITTSTFELLIGEGALLAGDLADSENSSGGDPSDPSLAGGDPSDASNTGNDPSDPAAGGDPSDPAAGGDPSDPSFAGDPSAGGEGQPRNSGPRQITFAQAADEAFRSGTGQDAFRFTYANYLVDHGSSGLQEMHMIPFLNAPGMSIRWGIGINYSAPGDFNQPPPVIGRDGNASGSGGGVDGGDPSGGSTGPGATDSTNGGSSAGPGDPANPGGDGTSGFDNGDGGGSQPSQNNAKETLLRYTGEVGKRLLEALDERRQRGDFGALIQGALAGPPARRGTPPGPRRRNTADQLLPGVTYIGMGKPPELVEIAREDFDLDLLIVMNVQVKVNVRTMKAQSDTSFTLHDLSQEGTRPFVGTSKMNNIKYQILAGSNEAKAADYLQDPFEKVFTKVDADYSIAKLPALQPAGAQFRVKSITESEGGYDDPLSVLAEIHYYHSRELLTDDERLDAYKALIGEVIAEKLVADSFEERKKALEKWLPRTPRGVVIVSASPKGNAPPKSASGGAGVDSGDSAASEAAPVATESDETSESSTDPAEATSASP